MADEYNVISRGSPLRASSLKKAISLILVFCIFFTLLIIPSHAANSFDVNMSEAEEIGMVPFGSSSYPLYRLIVNGGQYDSLTLAKNTGRMAPRDISAP